MLLSGFVFVCLNHREIVAECLARGRRRDDDNVLTVGYAIPGLALMAVELGNALLHQTFCNACIKLGWKCGVACSACGDQEFAGDALRVTSLE